jgi:pectin methylesterase-like acyl-CoA thioesterase
MERINQAAQQPNALQNLIEESKLGSDKFAQLVKDRAGQQITVRGQDIQAGTTQRGQDIQAGTTQRSRHSNNAARSRHTATAQTLPTVVSVILRLLKIKPQLRLAAK